MPVEPTFVVYIDSTGALASMTSWITAFVTGAFGLCTGLSVALMTWGLATRRERKVFRREDRLRALRAKEEYYLMLLNSIERAKQATRLGTDMRELVDTIAQSTATANLFASDDVNKKLGVVSDRLSEWSVEYRQSLPKKLGETGLGMISTESIKHSEKAAELYPALHDAIVDFVQAMKAELVQLRESVNQ